ncbi:ABC transporter permease [Umboniibacter marinipuniceus]|uniref:ABC-2 type transport system permease protein n=1 Tax=Umboniibacter marinipuniceus TaxID=569599 RepID=A0A3M0A0S8_9GAMM|nr:ABC transporter permease [Umboniibacter marinipuniceus]RMA78731.1 ABC-2 type transport system permease protein [Umboniibacter marinipuniceus]
MSWWRHIIFELRALIAHENTRMTVFIAAVGYAILYPLPYQHQLPTDIPMAAVDLDQSVASRRLLRMIDATPQVAVDRTVSSELVAQDLVAAQAVRGYLIIPKDFNRTLLRRSSSTLAMGGDGAYYLLYATQAEGVMGAVGALNNEISELIQLRGSPSVVNNTSAPFELALVNAFNPQLGYRNYVIPAVFLLILHQLALMGMATMTWVQRQRGVARDRYQQSWWRESSARLTAFLSVFLLLSLLYFYVLLPLYHVPISPFRIGVVAFLGVFFVATLLLGQLLGRLIPHPQIVVVVVIMSSLPLVFSAGFIWPVESIPDWWHLLMSAVPATTGIQYFLQIHLYNAPLLSVSSELIILSMIAVVTALVDYWLAARQRTSMPRTGMATEDL